MVNFRFHLVSLTAVFLALAAGIAIGAGVVDRQTVAYLEARLDNVEENRKETNARNDELAAKLTSWERFGEQAGTGMIEGRLATARVLVVGVEGTNRKPVDDLTGALVAAGAQPQGSLWFTPKWGLGNPDDVRALADILGRSPTVRPVDLRAEALARLVETWSAGSAGGVLVALRDAAFLQYDPPAGEERALEDVVLAGTLFVVASDDQADLPAADLAVPVVAAFAQQGVPLVAVQPAIADDRAPDAPPPFVVVLRGIEDVAARVSTVDNVNDYRGRVATVLALADLTQGRSGHYGIGQGAERVVPEQAAPSGRP
ncbi:MAG TPA: copper transporter [Acidimicrobiales bacterium]